MFNPLYGEQTVLRVANLWRSTRIPVGLTPRGMFRLPPCLRLPPGWFFKLWCQAELLRVPALLRQGSMRSSAPAATGDLCKSQASSDLG